MSIFKRVDSATLHRLIDDYEKGINVVSELNKNRVELDKVSRELDEKIEKLKQVSDEFTKIESETYVKKLEKESYENVLRSGEGEVVNLDKEIFEKRKVLNDLINNIDVQIEENKKKLESETSELVTQRDDLANKVTAISQDLISQETDYNDKEKEHIKNLFIVTEELKSKESKLEEVNNMISLQIKNIDSRNRAIDSRESNSGEREKKLNFYNARLQKMANKLNVQLKEL